MRLLNIVIFCFIILFILSCSYNVEKQIKIDENGYYIIYKQKLPKNYWEIYGKYRIHRLVTDYGLRIDSDLVGNLKNIYLYDRKNRIEYIVKNIDELEYIVQNKFPTDIIIYYYKFCTGGSGVKNEQEILLKINSILNTNKINFIFEPKEEKAPIIMETCLGS